MYLSNPRHIDHVKCINAGLVYKTIEQMGQISRIELSKLSQLAPASITKITRELIDAQLIEQTQDQIFASRGRPATGLVIKYDSWQFIAIRIGLGVGTIALHEMSTEILVDSPFEIHPSAQQSVSDIVNSALDHFLHTYAQRIENLICVSVIVQGEIDFINGVVNAIPHYNLSHWHIVDELYAKIHLPILLDKDVHAWALAESIFGNSQQDNNSILISMQQTISIGIILDHEVVNSSSCNVGDISDMQLPLHNQVGSASLQSLLSWSHIIKQVKKSLLAGRESKIQGKDISIDNICYCAKNGDDLCQEIIKEFGFYVGKAIANLLHVFNVEKILIGGELNIAKDIFYPEILKVITNEMSESFMSHFKMQQTLFYSEETMPCAALVKRKLYEGELLLQIIENTSNNK